MAPNVFAHPISGASMTEKGLLEKRQKEMASFPLRFP